MKDSRRNMVLSMHRWCGSTQIPNGFGLQREFWGQWFHSETKGRPSTQCGLENRRLYISGCFDVSTFRS